MAGLTATERRLFWRTLDAPHAAEDIDAGTLAPPNPDIPRGSAGMHCCGVSFEDREEADIHRDSIHDSRPFRGSQWRSRRA